MEVTILGSGVWIGNRETCRRGPGVLIEAANKRVLVDCSGGTNYQLAACGLDPNTIDMILLTHLHMDHCGGLIHLVGEMVLTGRKRRLEVYGPPETRNFFNNSVELYSKYSEIYQNLEQKLDVAVEEVSSRNFYCNGEISTSSFKLKHSVLNIGYRFLLGGKSLAITGDTEICEEIFSLAEECDLLICQCSHLERKLNHLNPELVAEVAIKSKPKRVVLTHFYPDCIAEEALRRIRKLWSGNVMAAEDLMKIKL